MFALLVNLLRFGHDLLLKWFNHYLNLTDLLELIGFLRPLRQSKLFVSRLVGWTRNYEIFKSADLSLGIDKKSKNDDEDSDDDYDNDDVDEDNDDDVGGDDDYDDDLKGELVKDRLQRRRYAILFTSLIN